MDDPESTDGIDHEPWDRFLAAYVKNLEERVDELETHSPTVKKPTATFILDLPGSVFTSKVGENCYHVVEVSEGGVKVIEQGGPGGDCVMLEVRGKDITMKDWWGWGE